ncbi:MAG: hypothetical protein ABH877_03055, partial [bacterium]
MSDQKSDPKDPKKSDPKKGDPKSRSADPVAQQLLERLGAEGIETAFDRHAQQGNRCQYGEKGVCCRICEMGPCRISLGGKGATRGVCGATAATIAARHLIRQVAAGAAAHSDHGHHIVKALKSTALGTAQGYTIQSEE